MHCSQLKLFNLLDTNNSIIRSSTILTKYWQLNIPIQLLYTICKLISADTKLIDARLYLLRNFRQYSRQGINENWSVHLWSHYQSNSENVEADTLTSIFCYIKYATGICNHSKPNFYRSNNEQRSYLYEAGHVHKLVVKIVISKMKQKTFFDDNLIINLPDA